MGLIVQNDIYFWKPKMCLRINIKINVGKV